MAVDPWSGKPENRVAGIIARGELRISTINSPMTFATMNNKAFGLDYELAKQFADYLGVTLKITVRQNISQLFDDLDDGQADMLAAGLVYNQERVKTIRPAPPTILFHNSWSTASAIPGRAPSRR
ncbi:transporter substrate-binding domain-containing protein [Klebsiella pneumoniae subsp. pneumoniae]|nr:transporter substrate-binding domain-containing protein [Klebsiella pneumoniae subsp. pneumoniae]